MEAENEAGWKVRIDSGPAGGGAGRGVRPNELLVMGLAGCSGIDILSILSKQRQELSGFEIELNAERDFDQIPAVLVSIHAHYVMRGEVDPEKARRAIELSLEKYCSVSKVLRKTADITYSFSINGHRYG